MALTRNFKGTVRARTLSDPAFRAALLRERAGARRDDTRIFRGTTKVFADLGYPDAEARQTRTRLAMVVNDLLHARKLKPRDAARLLHIPQSHVAALRDDRLNEFPVACLLKFLTALDWDVVITIQPATTGAGKMSVVVAS